MQKHPLHDSAARRAEVADKAMISATAGKSCQAARGVAQNEAPPSEPPERQRMVRVLFVRENAYHTVASESTQVDWLLIGCLHCTHTLDRQPMQKARNGRIAGRKSLVGGRLCEAPLESEDKGPAPSFDCTSGSQRWGIFLFLTLIIL